MSDDLKPCPLCNRAETQEYGTRTEVWAVWCVECKAQMESISTEAEAIAAWNTRATDPRIEALERELSLADDQRREWEHHCKTAEARLAECEARLGKAVEALRFYSCDNSCDECPMSERSRISCGWTARAVLAEIEGGRKDD